MLDFLDRYNWYDELMPCCRMKVALHFLTLRLMRLEETQQSGQMRLEETQQLVSNKVKTRDPVDQIHMCNG
jgi:hypothetical protein